jgi:hypothetical protein
LTVAPSTIVAPAAGGTASVTVAASGQCLYDAKTSAGWISITPTAQGVTLQFAPNTAAARTATIDIGGYVVTIQQAAPEVTNLLRNGSFDVDTRDWTSIYSSGTGSASWVRDPANATTVDGVADIRSTQARTGYQIEQCIVVQPDTRYEFGARVMIPSGQDRAGQTFFGVYAYETEGCAGLQNRNNSTVIGYTAPQGVWSNLITSYTTGAHQQSILVAIAVGGANTPPFRALFDDVFARVKR